MNRTEKAQDAGGVDADLRMDRRAAIKGGGLLLTAAAGGAFAPAVKASTHAKAILSSNDPLIAGFTPMSGSPGTVVTIDISGFTGVTPETICLALVADPIFGFANVLSADDSQIVAVVTHPDPALVAAPFGVYQGTGFLTNPAPPADTSFLDPVFSWIGNPGDPFAVSLDSFTLTPAANPARGGAGCWPPPQATVCNDFWGTASGGQLSVDIDFGGPTCPLGTAVDLHVHGLQTSGMSSFSFDYHSCLTTTSALPTAVCATNVCAVYQQAFFTNHGVFFGCIPSDLGGNIWRLTLTPAIPETFTGGWLGFRICTPL